MNILTLNVSKRLINYFEANLFAFKHSHSSAQKLAQNDNVFKTFPFNEHIMLQVNCPEFAEKLLTLLLH